MRPSAAVWGHLGQSRCEVTKPLNRALHIAYFTCETLGESEVCAPPLRLDLWFERCPFAFPLLQLSHGEVL